MNQVKKHLTPEDRVALICCTNRPNLLNVGECKKFFNEKFYFPYPDYSARQYLFKTLVKEHDIELSEFFPLGQFAFMTKGYTAGSVSSFRLILSVSNCF
jgi:SpoVK/Ycf46/Vps4 family AAA+-type ATPase